MENTAQDWKFDHCIQSVPDACAEITVALLDQLEKTGWSNKDTFGIHMAVEEAVMNAIRHGNQCCPDKEVRVKIEILGDRFYACITDQGCGFDPDDLPDPTDDKNIENTSGRGVMLMRSFVDEVVFNDQGNSVELKKNKSN